MRERHIKEGIIACHQRWLASYLRRWVVARVVGDYYGVGVVRMPRLNY